MTKLETSPEELFMLLGEQKFINYRLEEQNKNLLRQADEMANVISNLRQRLAGFENDIQDTPEESLASKGQGNGELGQPAHNDAIRRIRQRGEG